MLERTNWQCNCAYINDRKKHKRLLKCFKNKCKTEQINKKQRFKNEIVYLIILNNIATPLQLKYNAILLRTLE